MSAIIPDKADSTRTPKRQGDFFHLGAAHAKLVHSRRVRVLASHFAELLPTGSSVLDVGCGDGLIDRLVLDRRSDLRFQAVDVQVRPQTHVPVLPFDGSRLPFADASFDTVLFCDVLHHTLDPLVLLKEAARVARQHVLIKDHSAQGPLARLTLRLMDFVGNAPHGVALPYNYFSPLQWQAALAECRLVAVSERRKLRMYPKPADLVFGRCLHFIGLYQIAR